MALATVAHATRVLVKGGVPRETSIPTLWGSCIAELALPTTP
jgi:hypothetical protein